MRDTLFTVYRTASWDTSFALWGREHLIWLGLFCVSAAVLLPLYRRMGKIGRRRALLVLTGLLLADEAFKHLLLLALGEEDVDYLPLHLCSIGLFVCLWYAVHPNRYAGELLFAVSLPGAAVALLFPGWSVLPPWSLLSVHSFTFHMFLCLIPLALLASSELKPDPKRLWFCMLFLIVTAVPVWFVDRRFGTNFYFLTYPGVGNPLVWFEERFGNPGYQIGLPVCAAILWAVQYGIALSVRRIRENGRKRKAGETE